VLDGLAVDALGQPVERAPLGRECEVDVATALVAELLLAGRPDAQARVAPGREPDAVVLAREDLQAEHVHVEALERRHVARLEGQFAEAVDAHRARIRAGAPERITA
jgi:hypothetical protein